MSPSLQTTIADHLPLQRIYPSTDCCMVPLTRPVAAAKMSALARRAAQVSSAR